MGPQIVGMKPLKVSSSEDDESFPLYCKECGVWGLPNYFAAVVWGSGFSRLGLRGLGV